MRLPWTPAVLALSLTLTAAAQPAEAISIDGARMVNAPTRLQSGIFDDPEVLVFAEAAGFTLLEALELNGSVIPAGTVVDVYYVIFDPPGQVRKKTAVTFDVPILGIAFTSKKLRKTDFLGKPGTDYSRFSHRGFEAPAGTSMRDRISLSGSSLSIDFSVRASDPGDAVRVVVAHVPIPEPSAAALLAAGCLGLAYLGSRRRLA